MPNAPTDTLDLDLVPDAAPDSQGDPGLFASLELSDADQAKVDAAVRWLNQQVLASGLELAAEVKRYVLETFFDGEYERFADPSRGKPLSFSALCRREDLELGEATLHRLVRIARQVEELPGEIGRRLSISQHRMLLPVADTAVKVALAQRAVVEELTVEELGEAVRDAQPANKSGRPPLPVIVKQQRQIQRVLGRLGEVGEDKLLVEGLKRSELEELAATLRASEKRLGELRGAVERELKLARKVEG